MARLEWKEQFDTGIDIIDTQHKRIVAYINQLDELKIVHPLRPDPELGRVIAELIDYTMSHFIFEESLMEDAGYSFLNAHKKVHEHFTRRVLEFKARLQRGENIAKEIHNVLTSWLVNHILNDDANYVPEVKILLAKQNRGKTGGWFRNFFS